MSASRSPSEQIQKSEKYKLMDDMQSRHAQHVRRMQEELHSLASDYKAYRERAHILKQEVLPAEVIFNSSAAAYAKPEEKKQLAELKEKQAAAKAIYENAKSFLEFPESDISTDQSHLEKMLLDLSILQERIQTSAEKTRFLSLTLSAPMVSDRMAGEESSILKALRMMQSNIEKIRDHIDVLKQEIEKDPLKEFMPAKQSYEAAIKKFERLQEKLIKRKMRYEYYQHIFEEQQKGISDQSTLCDEVKIIHNQFLEKIKMMSSGEFKLKDLDSLNYALRSAVKKHQKKEFEVLYDSVAKSIESDIRDYIKFSKKDSSEERIYRDNIARYFRKSFFSAEGKTFESVVEEKFGPRGIKRIPHHLEWAGRQVINASIFVLGAPLVRGIDPIQGYFLETKSEGSTLNDYDRADVARVRIIEHAVLLFSFKFPKKMTWQPTVALFEPMKMHPADAARIKASAQAPLAAVSQAPAVRRVDMSAQRSSTSKMQGVLEKKPKKDKLDEALGSSEEFNPKIPSHDEKELLQSLSIPPPLPRFLQKIIKKKSTMQKIQQ